MNALVTLDVIDRLVGVEPGDRIDGLRALRPQARENAQRTFEALFESEDTSEAAQTERELVAVFTAVLHELPVAVAFYGDRAAASADPDVLEAVLESAEAARTTGPYGRYREPGLAGESTDGLRFRVSGAHRAVLGERLSAVLEHTHLLVFRPRESEPDALDPLLAAGWSPTGIVTISQLVAFLAFQLRVVAGLRAIARSEPEREAR